MLVVAVLANTPAGTAGPATTVRVRYHQRRALQAPARSSDSSSASSITVTGLQCHAPMNAVYERQQEELNGRSQYTTADGKAHLYWQTTPGRDDAGWVLGADTTGQLSFASWRSTASEPDSGTWSEFCRGAWHDVSLTLKRPTLSGNDVAARLAIAPPSLTVGGLACHPSANSVYELQPYPMNGKSQYMTADGNWHLFWMYSGYWFIHTAIDDIGAEIGLQLDSETPPAGDRVWEEKCGQPDGEDAWTMAVLNVDAPLTSENCGALATYILEQPPCDTRTEGSCTLACAQAWLLGAASCTGKQASFEAHTPSSIQYSCRSTAASLLATAPATVSISGLQCHPGANAVYELQAAPMNGKSQYRTADGRWSLFWMPARSSWTGNGEWSIGVSTDDSSSDTILISTSELPPLGSAVWRELCDTWQSSRIELSGGQLDVDACTTNLAAVMPRLIGTCCQFDANEACGQPNVLPNVCSSDCGILWNEHVRQCPGSEDDAFALGDLCKGAAGQTIPLLDQTVPIQEHGSHDFPFAAHVGTRYRVAVRVGDGSGLAIPCPANLYDGTFGVGACIELLAQGGSCADNFCASCGHYAHYCDVECRFLCSETGVSATRMYVLPPYAIDTEAAVVSETTNAADKDIAFTATTTGTYTARIFSNVGTGSVDVVITEEGTALARSPELYTDGEPHLLSVACTFTRCAFDYDHEPAFDGDGSGFDLLMSDAEAGRAYAFMVELPEGQSAARIRATLYQADASSGSGAFQPVIDGPVGQWTSTPAEHESYFEHIGCANDDRQCPGHAGEIRDSFGIYPGDKFGSVLTGTWVAPGSGPVLLRLVMNCDVPFFADVQADGCWDDHTSYGCDPQYGVDNSKCYSKMWLTVTPGAYYHRTVDGHRRAQSDGGHLHPPSLALGPAHRTDTILIQSAVVEAHAEATWTTSTMSDGKLSTAPALKEMLVTGTPAHAFLTSLLSVYQQPHVVYPVAFNIIDSKMIFDEGDGYGHRRIQTRGDILQVSVETHAPSVAEAGRAEQLLVARLPGVTLVEEQGRRRAQQGGDHLHQTAETHVCGLGSTEVGCTSSGQIKQSTRLQMSRTDVESLVSDREQARSLADMMVPGSTANALLASSFVETQTPVVAFPTDIHTSLGDSHHRLLQEQGSQLHVTIETHAPTAAAALDAVNRLASKFDATVGASTCDLTSRAQAVNDECCDEPTEDCSSGVPASCNAGCAAMVLPFFSDCFTALGVHATKFDSIVAMCEDVDTQSDGYATGR